MLICRNPKFLFVHIQKTGGVSMTELLRRKFSSVEYFGDYHGFARDGLRLLGEVKFAKFYKFALVRNPWDRLVSWWSMLQQKRGKHNPMKHAAIRHGNNFASFIRYATESVPFPNGDRSFAFNQIDYLSDEAGNLLVDAVYRFEEFDDACQKILKKLGKPLRKQPSIPHKNASSHAHYSKFYTPELREIVADRFSRDIAAFGYTFDTGETCST